MPGQGGSRSHREQRPPDRATLRFKHSRSAESRLLSKYPCRSFMNRGTSHRVPIEILGFSGHPVPVVILNHPLIELIGYFRQLLSAARDRLDRRRKRVAIERLKDHAAGVFVVNALNG